MSVDKLLLQRRMNFSCEFVNNDPTSTLDPLSVTWQPHDETHSIESKVETKSKEAKVRKKYREGEEER